MCRLWVCVFYKDNQLYFIRIVRFIQKIKDCDTFVNWMWIYLWHLWMQNGKAFPKMYDMSQHYSLKVLAIAYFLWSYFNNICVHYFISWVAYLWMPRNHDSSKSPASKFFLVANTCKKSVLMKFHPCYNDQKGLKLKLLLAPWSQCILVRFGLYVFYTLWASLACITST